MSDPSITYCQPSPDVTQAQAAVNAARREWQAAHDAEVKASKRTRDLGLLVARDGSHCAEFNAADAEWARLSDECTRLFAAHQDACDALDAAREQRKADEIAALRNKLLGASA